jgi:hypothetical protein
LLPSSQRAATYERNTEPQSNLEGAIKYIIALFLGCYGFAASAQTVIALGAGECNVAHTTCNVPNDAADVITFVYDSRNGEVTLVVTTVSADLTTSTVTYSGLLEFSGSTTGTTFLTVTPFSATLSPNAEISGNIRKTRSGSGRGGWAWHMHWDFETLVIY